MCLAAMGDPAEALAAYNQAFAVTAAKFLVAPGGPSIAVLSLDGFDTHANQGNDNGQLAGRLPSVADPDLARLLATLTARRAGPAQPVRLVPSADPAKMHLPAWPWTL